MKATAPDGVREFTFTRRDTMRAFYIINDTSHIVIWDDLIMSHVTDFPTCPKGWKSGDSGRYKDMTEGDWTLGCGMHQMASPDAYKNAGIPQPTFDQLPAVFCVTDKEVGGQYKREVEGLYNVTAEDAAKFIRERI
jgi:hypothetical protein